MKNYGHQTSRPNRVRATLTLGALVVVLLLAFVLLRRNSQTGRASRASRSTGPSKTPAGRAEHDDAPRPGSPPRAKGARETAAPVVLVRVLGPRGEPVANAPVTALAEHRQRPELGRRRFATVRTSAEGVAEIVAPRKLRATCERDGRAIRTFVGLQGASDDREYIDVDVTKGGEYVLRVSRRALASLFPFRVRVLSAGDTPVADVPVSLFGTVVGARSSPQTLASGTTGKSGYVNLDPARFRDFRSRAARVGAKCEFFVGADVVGRTLVVVAPQDRSTESEAWVVRLRPSAAISFQCVDDSGKSLHVGGAVALGWRSPDEEQPRGPRPITPFVPFREGKATIRNVALGFDLRAFVRLPRNYKVAAKPLIPPIEKPGGIVPVAVTILWQRLLIVHVVASDGSPVWGRVRIRISSPKPAGGASDSGKWREYYVDKDGNCQFPLADETKPPGDRVVELVTDSDPPLVGRASLPSDAAQGNRKVRVVVSPKSSKAGKRVIRGLVRDERGQPIAGASVLVRDWTDPGTATGRVRGQILADRDGRFVVPDLPDDRRLRVEATASGYCGSEVGSVAPEQTEVSLVLARECMVVGSVPLDEGTPAGLLSVRLTAVGVAGLSRDAELFNFDRRGSFVFKRIRRGKYRASLWIRNSTWMIARSDGIIASPDRPARVTGLDGRSRLLLISLRLVADPGVTLSALSASVVDGSGKGILSMRPDSAGRMRFLCPKDAGRLVMRIDGYRDTTIGIQNGEQLIHPARAR